MVGVAHGSTLVTILRVALQLPAELKHQGRVAKEGLDQLVVPEVADSAEVGTGYGVLAVLDPSVACGGYSVV